MQDASWQNRIRMQCLSNSPTADSMDMEIDKMEGDYLAGKPVISYLRYNFAITEKDLNELNLDRIFTAADVKSLTDMSNASNRQLLYQVGWAASGSIKTENFDKF